MKIAIIAAMRKELTMILSMLPHHKENDFEGFTVYEGQYGPHRLLLAQCGIGKVNSALMTKSMIEKFNPELVINSGVAGGVDSSMDIGSVLVADRIAYHDVWCGPGTVYGQADDCPLFYTPYVQGLEIMRQLSLGSSADIRFGLLCSGDKFISTPAEVSEIKSRFPDALGCDMESASIAQTCFKCGVPFMIVRVMSDMPGGGENISEYQNFWSEAPERTFHVITDLLSHIES